MASEFFSKAGRKIKQHRFGLALAAAVVVGFVVYPLGIMIATGTAVYILWLVLSALVGFVGGELIKWLSTRFLQCFSKKWGEPIIAHLSDCMAVGALFLVASFFFPPLAIPGILFLTGPMVVNGIAFLVGAAITGILKIFRYCFCPPAASNRSLPDDFGISDSSLSREQRQNNLSHQNDDINRTGITTEEQKSNVMNGNERVNDEIDDMDDKLMENEKLLPKYSKQSSNALMSDKIMDHENIKEFVDELTEKEKLLSQQHNLNNRPNNINIPSDAPSLSNNKNSSGRVYTPSTPHTVFTMKSESIKKTWKDWGIFKCCRCCRGDDSYDPSYKYSNETNLPYDDDGTTYLNYKPEPLKKDLSTIAESQQNSVDGFQNSQNIIESP